MNILRRIINVLKKALDKLIGFTVAQHTSPPITNLSGEGAKVIDAEFTACPSDNNDAVEDLCGSPDDLIDFPVKIIIDLSYTLLNKVITGTKEVETMEELKESVSNIINSVLPGITFVVSLSPERKHIIMTACVPDLMDSEQVCEHTQLN